jgi:para-aminobenzoate synthetase component 1
MNGYRDPVSRSELPSADGATSGVIRAGSAWFGGLRARGLVDASDDVAALDQGGWWAVVVTFEGELRLWRFERVDTEPLPGPLPGPAAGPATAGRPWRGPLPGSWRSSLSREEYLSGVEEIRRRIRDGDVYQVNLCRVLTGPLRENDADGDPWALAARIAAGNPAPYAGVVDVPAVGRVPRTRLVCASPELFLGRAGDRIRSGPIKGTAATEADLLPKDKAENVMIVDLVRNDLQRVSQPGTIAVPSLLRVEHHPGLVHLVSTVEGRLGSGVTWRDIFAATLPPGSVSGAPKSTAMRAIGDLEPVPRGPYCGAIGFIDADRRRARLAVGIRTFWWHGASLRFGTGAGITWGSDPAGEWAETELKAARLISLASDHADDQVSSLATAASRSR